MHQPGAASAAPPGAEGSWLRPLLPLAASIMLVSMVSQFRLPLLPDMGAELAMSAAQLGLVTTMFAVGRLALDVPVGRLADKIDPLRLLAYAAATMAAASIMLGLAPSAVWVLAATVLVGAASATANTTGMTALAGSAPSSRRGLAMALYSGSLLGGQALGPTVSGLAASLGTWRTACFVAGALGLVVYGGATLWRRRTGHRQVHRSTGDGSEGPETGLTPLQRNVAYSIGFSGFFAIGAMSQTLIPLIGAADHDLQVATIGAGLGLGGIARMVGAAVGGGVSDRVSRRAALLPSLALQVIGVGLLAVPGGPVWWVAAIVLMSLGSSGIAVGATMIGDRTHGSRLGRTLGHYRFAGDFGLMAGPALGAVAYDVWGAPASVALVNAVLIASGIAVAMFLPETHSARR